MTPREQLHQAIRRTEDLRRRRRIAVTQLTAQWDEENDFAQRDAANRDQINEAMVRDTTASGRMINLALADYPHIG